MISELLRNRILLSLFVTLLAMANPAMARLISASETWLATNSPYTIAEDIVIEPGSMLTIQPGVVVNTTFDAPGSGNNILAVEFFNSGELSLSGTPLSPVSIGPATASYPAPSVRSSSGATLTARNLFLTGDLMLDPGATYVATPTERISVQGDVALGGALVLTGVAATTRGQSYILIEKTTLGPVSGTFSGMAEGAVFRMGGASWVITYTGGDGNDVTISRTDPAPALYLAPNLLSLAPNSSGEITIYISSPAGSNDEVVLLTTTGTLVSVPAQVVIPAGSASAAFVVTAGSATGAATIYATLGPMTGSTSVVVIDSTTSASCRSAVKATTRTAMLYQEAVRQVSHACSVHDDRTKDCVRNKNGTQNSCHRERVDCPAALSQLSATFGLLAVSNSVVSSSCSGR